MLDLNALRAKYAAETAKIKNNSNNFTSQVFDDSVIAATQLKSHEFSPLERVLMGHPNPSSDGAKQ